MSAELTMLEVLEETVQYYSQDVSRRSKSGEGCLYNGPEGRVCAFAYWVKPESRISLMEHENASYQDTNRLKPEVQKLSGDFWDALQQLHDINKHWNMLGLSESGLMCVAEIKKQIAGGRF